MTPQLDFDFKFLGNLDVKLVAENLLTFTEEQWRKVPIRQRKFRAHSQTQSLPIIWDYMSLLNNKVGKLQEDNYNQLNFKLIEPQIISLCEKHYGVGVLLRVLIAKLRAYGNIPKHTDGTESLKNVKRIHIPLITNEKCTFIVGKTQKNLKVGEVWEINNQNSHEVHNNSNQDRAHLIVDYLPKI